MRYERPSDAAPLRPRAQARVVRPTEAGSGIPVAPPTSRSAAATREPQDRSAGQGRGAAGPRVTIRDVVLSRRTGDTEAIVTLSIGDRSGRGTALSPPTTSGHWHALARATVAAFLRVTEADAQIGLDRVHVDRQGSTPAATVLLTSRLPQHGGRAASGGQRTSRDAVGTAVDPARGRRGGVGGAGGGMSTSHGEVRLLGVALVRDDPAGAVVRATLDALNRRVVSGSPTALVV
jgi:hypothetical protein